MTPEDREEQLTVAELHEATVSALAEEREAALRDVFATAALGSLIVARGRNAVQAIDAVADEAYVYADAMMKARRY